jgi:hypothetical protein
MAAAESTFGIAGHEAPADPEIIRAPWGYVIRAGGYPRRSENIAGPAGKLLSAVLLLGAAAMWASPPARWGGDVAVMKLATTVLFLILGGSLAWSTRREAQGEVQVDLVRRELRLGMRRGQGRFHLDALLQFREVGAVVLTPGMPPAVPAALFLRIGKSNRALEAATGSEAALVGLGQRLVADIGIRAMPAPTHSPEAATRAAAPF